MFVCRKASNGHHCFVLEKGMDGINGFLEKGMDGILCLLEKGMDRIHFLGEKKNYSGKAANPNENNRLSART